MIKLITAMAILFAPLASKSTDLYEIVPLPQSIEQGKGQFKVAGAAIKYDQHLDAQTILAIEQFASKLSLTSGKTSSVAPGIGICETVAAGKAKGLLFIKDSGIAPEGYSLSVQSSCAIVKASDFNGFFYAIQTIKQLLPEAIYGTATVDGKWSIPQCRIEDSPRFSHRGAHMDSARHFWQVDEVKRYLDVMAMYKLNRLHWHLTDDQGWRIEIDRYPLLTQISCWRNGTQIGLDRDTNDGIRYGGFYTKEQIREIVKYAAGLGITIVPEVDLPGHMVAALAAYPELGCEGGPYNVRTTWGISKEVLCAGKESTFEFIENVLTEVTDLFPGEYIHIGGDECPKDAWEKCPDCQAKIKELGIVSNEHGTAEQHLQNYVTARVQKFLESKGKKVIGWDEIMEGELGKGVTVMSWRGLEHGQRAAREGFDVIMTPRQFCYLDYRQDEDVNKEPVAIKSAPLVLSKVYSLDPCEGLDEQAGKHILGAQCNLWTEYISTPEHLEYMLLPRLLAGAEVQWCKPENKNFDRFKAALDNHQYKVLETAHYNFKRY